MVQCLGSAALAAVAFAASSAQAGYACNAYYQPGMLAYFTNIRPAPPCAYQGDYMVNQGPVYDGPAAIAPQPTYAPSRTATGYAYVHGRYQPGPVMVEPEPVRRHVKRVGKRSRQTVVNVKSDLPASKGKPQVVNARAVVRIYGPERMDIRLYRR